MTNIQRLEAIVTLARQANAPAEAHERCLAIARELAQAIEALEKKPEPAPATELAP